MIQSSLVLEDEKECHESCLVNVLQRDAVYNIILRSVFISSHLFLCLTHVIM